MLEEDDSSSGKKRKKSKGGRVQDVSDLDDLRRLNAALMEKLDNASRKIDLLLSENESLKKRLGNVEEARILQDAKSLESWKLLKFMQKEEKHFSQE